jgi:hypothetical protein
MLIAIFFTVTPIKSENQFQEALKEIENPSLSSQDIAVQNGMGFIRPLSYFEVNLQLPLQTTQSHQGK